MWLQMTDVPQKQSKLPSRYQVITKFKIHRHNFKENKTVLIGMLPVSHPTEFAPTKLAPLNSLYTFYFEFTCTFNEVKSEK